MSAGENRAEPAGMTPPWLLGITGGIGTGKSTLCGLLSRREGWPVIDADRIGHEALRPGSELLPALRSRFGEETLGPDGTIRRDLLATVVFADPTALAALNEIVHPWIVHRILADARALRASASADIILVDAALLLDWLGRFHPDAIAAVVAPLRVRLRRLEHKGMARKEALRRIRSQSRGIGEQVDWIIENGGTVEELDQRARVLALEVKKRRGDPARELRREGGNAR